MRWLHIVLGAVLIIFATLQYNDPDPYLWGPIYGFAALWALLAAWRPALLGGRTAVRLGAITCAILFLIGFAWLAPTIGRDWIQVEEAREALGYLICAVSTGLALWTGLRQGHADAKDVAIG
jgi:hypothetical protein